MLRSGGVLLGAAGDYAGPETGRDLAEHGEARDFAVCAAIGEVDHDGD